MCRLIRFGFMDTFAPITIVVLAVLNLSLIVSCFGVGFWPGLGSVYGLFCLSMLGAASALFCLRSDLEQDQLINFSAMTLAWLGFCFQLVLLSAPAGIVMLVYALCVFALSALMLLSICQRVRRIKEANKPG